jgi:ubiquinone/menaquinone biosynthesis C-methylase UbiE
MYRKIMATSFDNPYVSALQTFYNKVGQNYDATTSSFHTEGASRMIEAAGPAIKEGSYVLDLASGTGNVALAAATKVGSKGRVLCIDISDTFLAQAAIKAKQSGLADIAKFSHQDVTDLILPAEFPAHSFEAVTCGSAIAMFPDVKAVVRIAATEILKPGGVFLADMNAGNIPARLFLDAATPKGFQPPFDPSWLSDVEGSLRRIFEGSTFEVKEVLARDISMGTKHWDVSTAEKLDALWDNIAFHQSWVSFGVDKLSKEVLEEVKEDWISKVNELSNDDGLLIGGMKQYIIVAALNSE